MFTLHIPRSPSENTINLKTSRRPVYYENMKASLDDVTPNLIQRAFYGGGFIFDLGGMW